MKLLLIITVACICTIAQTEKKFSGTDGDDQSKSIIDAVIDTQAQDLEVVTVTDITPRVYRTGDLAEFPITQTSLYITIRHPDLKFFTAEVYDKAGHLISEHRSSGGVDTRLKIPMDTFTGKTLFVNMKDSELKVVKTFKFSQGAVFSAKE